MTSKQGSDNTLKKALTQNKPQSDFVLSCFLCPGCNKRLCIEELIDFTCPECGTALPDIDSIYRAKTEKDWTFVPIQKKETANQSSQPKNEKVKEELIPGVEVGTFAFFGKGSKEYMVIDIGDGKYHGLRVVAAENCQDNDFVQSVYRDRVVILDKKAIVIMPSQIKRTKARLAKHIVQSIIDKHKRCMDNKKYSFDRKSNEKRNKKGDGLYVGNAWDGLSITSHHIKVYRG